MSDVDRSSAIQPTRRILVIDDLRIFEREDWIIPPHEYTYARTQADGLAAVESMLSGDIFYEELWLDHDLGGDDTTRPIVMRLVEEAVVNEKTACKWVRLITANPVGLQWIRSQLDRYYHVYA